MKSFLKFILPLIIVVIAFGYNLIAGFISIIACIAYWWYIGRTAFYAWKGAMSYNTGDTEGAFTWMDKAYKTGRAKPETAVSYAYLFLKSGRLEEAEKVLDKLKATKLPMEKEMLVKSNYALLLWKKGMLDDAVEMLERVSDNYRNTVVYGSLGYLLILKGDLEKALKYNLEAYDYNSSDKVIMDNLGQTYYMLGEYEKAEEIYGKLMAARPAFPEAYYNYGLVLEKTGRIEPAVESMKKAMEYKFTYLSTVSKEEIETKIKEMLN